MADLALGFTLTAAAFTIRGKPASDRIAYVFTRSSLFPVRESLLKRIRLTVYATENSVRISDEDLASHVMFNTRVLYGDHDGSDDGEDEHSLSSEMEGGDTHSTTSDMMGADGHGLRMDQDTALWCSKYRASMSKLHSDDRKRLLRMLDWTRSDPYIAADIVKGAAHILSRNAHQLMRQMIFPVRVADDAHVSAAAAGAHRTSSAKRRKLTHGGAGAGRSADGASDTAASLDADGMPFDATMGDDDDDEEQFPQHLTIPEHMPFQFFPAPDSLKPFFSMSVYGPTGSGKSVWIALFLLLYTKIYDTRIIFLGFEPDDPAYMALRHLTEVMTMPTVDQVTAGEVTIDRFLPGQRQQTVVLFDDSECFDAKRTRVVSQVRDILLRNGRKSNVSVICVHHRTMGSAETSASRIETTYKVFMLAGNGKRLLHQYWRNVMGYSDKQTHRALKPIRDHERFVCLHETIPTYVLTAARIMTPR